MDNEAPKYADWVPEAGGYVANGKVVSKSPLYDEGGKLRMYVDPKEFGNIQPASPQAQPTNTLVGNSGVQTANIAGSGTDANAAATSIGSNGSLNLNTANTDNSAISSPATKSNVTGDIVLNPVDKANQNYQDAIGRNDLQGAINALTELGRLTGQDYSTQINDLTNSRNQKIRDIDDQFLYKKQQLQDAYNQAIKSGDTEAAQNAADQLNALNSQQDQWRNQVGYQSAMNDMQRREEEEILIDYQSAYMGGINDIANQIAQATQALINFQYDPTQDSNLLRAQAMVEARMRNNGAATGMYYSSTTQYAIAQAVGELIPVYQKMAREEAMENINLLQSTASFLMNLEKTQFDMWATQVEMKWRENEEKRKQWQQALDASNARGYVNNEEAMWLGVEPGSLSKEAQDHARDLQEQIEKEQRQFEQEKALASFKMQLEIEKMKREYQLKTSYALATGEGGGGEYDDTPDDSSSGFAKTGTNTFTYNGKTYNTKSGTLTSDKMQDLYEDYVDENDLSESDAIERTLRTAKNPDEAERFLAYNGFLKTPIGNEKQDATSFGGEYVMVGPERMLKETWESLGKPAYSELQQTKTTQTNSASKVANTGVSTIDMTASTNANAIKNVIPGSEKRKQEVYDIYQIAVDASREYGDSIVVSLSNLKENGDITQEEMTALVNYTLGNLAALKMPTINR